ncbi:MAG: hypothetical protein AAB928_00555, partial [Patescibacteria group bacterium]
IYQWLFRRNDFKVSDTAYFVYANGQADAEAFDGRLEFDVAVLAYQGNDGWVEGAIADIYKCLTSATLPPGGPDCDFCRYREAVEQAEE